MEVHKRQLDSILAKCQNERNMLLISRNKYEKIVQYLKLGTGASYRFKSWIQRQRFQLLQLPDEDQTEVLVVPKEVGTSKGYVRVLHENQIYGKVRDIHVCVLNHGNYTQTVQSVSDLYYDISEDYISEFVRRCDCCQEDSTSDGSHLHTSSTMKVSARPMKVMNKVDSCFLQDVSVNIIDMRLKPSNEFCFIGHVEDQFSNFSVLFPLKNDSSKEIAKNLKKYFLSYFGPPKNFSSGDIPKIASVLDEVSNSWKGNSLSLEGVKIQTKDTQTPETDEVAAFIRDSICLIAAEGYNEREWSDWLPEIMLKLNVARRPSASQDPYTVVFSQPASVLSEFDELLPGRDGSDVSAQENPHDTMKSTEGKRPEEQSHDTSNTSTRDDPNALTAMLNDVHVKQEPTSDEEFGRAGFPTIKDKNIAETLSVSAKTKNLQLGIKVKENTSEYSVGKTVLPCDNSKIKQEDIEDATVPCESSSNIPVDFRREDYGSIESPRQDNDTYNSDVNNHYHDQEVGDTGTSVQIPPETVHWREVGKRKWHYPRQTSKGDASRMDASETDASVPRVSRKDASKTAVSDPISMKDSVDLMTRYTAGNGDETNSEDLGQCVEIDIAEEDTSWDPCAERTREGHQKRKPLFPPPLEAQEIRRKLTKEDVCFVERLKRENPILTLSEIREHLRIERGVEVHVSTVSRAIKKKSCSYQEAAFLNPQDGSPSDHGSNGRQTDSDNSRNKVDLMKDRKQLMHKNFLPQDEVFLTYLLHRKPYLTNSEVKQQLERQRGLSISLHYLNKKIAGMVGHRNNHENQQAHRQGRVHSSRNRNDSTMVGSPTGTQASVTLQGQQMMTHQKQPSVMKKWTSRGTNDNETIMGENSLKQTAVPQAKSSPVHKEQLHSGHLSRQMLMPAKRKVHDSLVVDLSDSPPQVLENGRNNYSKRFCHAKTQNFRAGCESVNQHVTNISVNNNMSPGMYDEDTELMVQSDITPPEKKELEADRGQIFSYETRNDIPHRNIKLQPADLDFLECLKRQNPSITLTEMKYRLLDERNLDVHVSSVCRALKKIVHTQEEMEPNYLVYINSQEAECSAEYQVDNEDSLLDESQFDECSDPQVSYSDECVQPSNSHNFSHRTSYDLPGNLYSGSPDYILQEDAEDETHPGNQLKPLVEDRIEGKWDGLDVTNNKKLTLKDMQLIKQLKADDPTMTLRNMKAWLLKENGKDVHLSTISRALKKMNGSLNNMKNGDVIDLTL